MVDGAGGDGGAVVGEGLAADGGEVAAGGGGAAVHCTSTAPAAVIAASVAAIGCPRRSRERSGGWRPGRECAARLVSSYSSRHVRVNGDCNVMDEPRVPLLVRLQVRGQGMTVWALLRAGGLVLGLLHGAAPPRKWVFLHRGTNQTPRPLSGVRRVAMQVRSDRTPFAKGTLTRARSSFQGRHREASDAVASVVDA